MAGENGSIAIRFFDGLRGRLKVAYVGEGGIEPDTFYKLDENGDFVLAEDTNEK